MFDRIVLGDIVVEVVKKDIENIHLSVNPPTGKVVISAPIHVELDSIRVFAASKIGWIRQQQKKFNAQERETPREYLDRESHYLWGKRYLLEVEEQQKPPAVEATCSRLVLQVRPGTESEKRQEILDGWYREQVKEAVSGLIAKWSPVIGVQVSRFYVQRMKTRWGSCCTSTQSIRINSELAKKPPECLEYVVVHEMVHLIEPTHKDCFNDIMGRCLPQWQHFKQILNELPLAHETWHDRELLRT